MLDIVRVLYLFLNKRCCVNYRPRVQYLRSVSYGAISCLSSIAPQRTNPTSGYLDLQTQGPIPAVSVVWCYLLLILHSSPAYQSNFRLLGLVDLGSNTCGQCHMVLSLAYPLQLPSGPIQLPATWTCRPRVQYLRSVSYGAISCLSSIAPQRTNPTSGYLDLQTQGPILAVSVVWCYLLLILYSSPADQSNFRLLGLVDLGSNTCGQCRMVLSLAYPLQLPSGPIQLPATWTCRPRVQYLRSVSYGAISCLSSIAPQRTNPTSGYLDLQTQGPIPAVSVVWCYLLLILYSSPADQSNFRLHGLVDLRSNTCGQCRMVLSLAYPPQLPSGPIQLPATWTCRPRVQYLRSVSYGAISCLSSIAPQRTNPTSGYLDLQTQGPIPAVSVIWCYLLLILHSSPAYQSNFRLLGLVDLGSSTCGQCRMVLSLAYPLQLPSGPIQLPATWTCRPRVQYLRSVSYGAISCLSSIAPQRTNPTSGYLDLKTQGPIPAVSVVWCYLLLILHSSPAYQSNFRLLGLVDLGSSTCGQCRMVLSLAYPPQLPSVPIQLPATWTCRPRVQYLRSVSYGAISCLSSIAPQRTNPTSGYLDLQTQGPILAVSVVWCYLLLILYSSPADQSNFRLLGLVDLGSNTCGQCRMVLSLAYPPQLPSVPIQLPATWTCRPRVQYLRSVSYGAISCLSSIAPQRTNPTSGYLDLQTQGPIPAVSVVWCYLLLILYSSPADQSNFRLLGLVDLGSNTCGQCRMVLSLAYPPQLPSGPIQLPATWTCRPRVQYLR